MRDGKFDYPMILSWGIGDSIDVKYMIAPRMDDV
jgi:hypothetical protein